MQTSKIKHSSYDVELNHLTVCALLFLAINDVKGSPSYENRKLHKWLLSARKQKRFSRLVASDLEILIQKSAMNVDVVRILEDLNNQYGNRTVNSNKNRLFNSLKTLEVYDNIKSIFVSDDQSPFNGKKGEKKIVILESELEKAHVYGSLTMSLIGDINETVTRALGFESIDFKIINIGSENGTIITQLEILFN
ncbi:DUF2913 family protein [Moritella sp. F3]|uniref:DUF2913 family protein n=1 Tax=Moritella sp. F3 TaxID=2718882 RepID=UPI0018E0EEBD|nr:DUF2913 family protein [Moritella sp. F3]GIC77061.1 hypothetical protein FMO001_17880 [Moritella sp. F1]GIC82180.1 hypothetical protein FMO003_24610 [Moritella sp. F3]